MDILEVHLDQIVWDLESRVHLDITSMKENIQKVGLLTPLYVVGPDKHNKYFLIDGSRRYAALKALALYNQKFKNVKVIRYNENIGTKLEREILRFHLHNTSKKIIGAEVQTAIENIQETGQYSDEKVIEVVQPKPSHIKRMKRSQKIDKNLRDEVSENRASQHALEVIYNMAISTKQFSKLYHLLLNRKLTGTDADALKKLDSHPLFSDLTDEQKSNVINKTLEQARFTNKEAMLIILSEIMKDTPNDYSESALDWINYLARSLDEIASMIHSDIELLANNLQREQLRATLSKLNKLLSWTWNHESQKNKSSNELNKSYPNLISEETQTGYKFRLH
ncbi:ParB/RepB/Spo0J family partition protein [Heyndrickxia vini]|uniref:ParB/RepB/Spo0J family partition protein n=1 Tax=Heyndrickxia vini TaxID=1476025 RepID=A0ABX7E2D5_9BACI|nr:ParB/RepB/Spo0J family partition protein [Heyndrickxia vini]QQZ09424.1 ParB/RepB/Spo0J family partition protein [Heyndrickxia vini]